MAGLKEISNEKQSSSETPGMRMETFMQKKTMQRMHLQKISEADCGATRSRTIPVRHIPSCNDAVYVVRTHGLVYNPTGLDNLTDRAG